MRPWTLGRLSLRRPVLPFARTPGAALLQRRFNSTTSSDPRPSDGPVAGPYTPPSLSQATTGWTWKDHFAVGPARRLNTLLNDLLPDAFIFHDGYKKAMPQGSHLVYFPIHAAPSNLAPDGAESQHVPGGFDLTKPGATRLWVGGSLTFSDDWAQQVRCFEPGGWNTPYLWTCRETFAGMKVLKRGDESKAVVELKRTYGTEEEGPGEVGEEPAEEQVYIEETRLLAFVPNFEPKATSFGTPGEPDFEYKFTPTPEQLFQFSALTNNAHFIHLDREKGIVHGPLTLALMLRTLTHAVHGPTGTVSDVLKISYRNLCPLYVGQEATICLRKRPGEIGRSPEETKNTPEHEKDSISVWDVWIQEPGGGMAVKATAHVRTAPAQPPKTKKYPDSDRVTREKVPQAFVDQWSKVRAW
ncbi:unnamed protein product [Clonostachys rosea f. rosea IK726]|uniref:Uncharacterized protein n=1 Tax=Clonostachys rosea f. rosea IK726 TaxID=1349383 RepID=A0ACA9TFV2_BIOOC|nr:unnamed protein product [Clonostachys rosea f. rosea IK726]